MDIFPALLFFYSSDKLAFLFCLDYGFFRDIFQLRLNYGKASLNID